MAGFAVTQVQWEAKLAYVVFCTRRAASFSAKLPVTQSQWKDAMLAQTQQVEQPPLERQGFHCARKTGFCFSAHSSFRLTQAQWKEETLTVQAYPVSCFPSHISYKHTLSPASLHTAPTNKPCLLLSFTQIPQTNPASYTAHISYTHIVSCFSAHSSLWPKPGRRRRLSPVQTNPVFCSQLPQNLLLPVHSSYKETLSPASLLTAPTENHRFLHTAPCDPSPDREGDPHHRNRPCFLHTAPTKFYCFLCIAPTKRPCFLLLCTQLLQTYCLLFSTHCSYTKSLFPAHSSL